MVENWNVWAGDTKVIMYPKLYNMNWSLLNLPNWKVMRVQQRFIIKWKHTSQLERQQDERAQQAAWTACHLSQFHQHPAPSSYLWLYRGRERESYMIKWKRRKMSKLSSQMDWFSMCKSKMVRQLYYIPTPEWSWETVTKGKSFPWVLCGIPGHIHSVWKEK